MVLQCEHFVANGAGMALRNAAQRSTRRWHKSRFDQDSSNEGGVQFIVEHKAKRNKAPRAASCQTKQDNI
jgi:hypothetical protein